ncbi:DUF2007 domain-containing protein [Maribacter sp. PR1]|uniref:DUF2007 domain-containing protein n=1 Tax=Maribacter cobaltidurans TaxID=1178778 RepID=A0ABU7IWY5_9FLAO|nr:MULTISPECIES: DUF2007 domain-containing protein [Maribacter]MDC6390010.1 DUF2007 domain-containing protein [Maribacter sp. PR1]MEE1977400.1 DUF2007 domain-containing protein [Maribacter cobaltidurans]
MNTDYIKVFGGNSAKSNRIEQILKDSGIEPIVKSESESARLAGFGTPLPHISEIYVHRDEEKKALELISNIAWEE